MERGNHTCCGEPLVRQENPRGAIHTIETEYVITNRDNGNLKTNQWDPVLGKLTKSFNQIVDQ